MDRSAHAHHPFPSGARRALCVIALALASGCTRESKSPPAAAPPDVGVPMPSSTALSRFSVPLEYDFTSVLKLVEQIVPTRFGSMDSVRQMGDDDRKHYAFAATRGFFTAFVDDNQLYLRATIAYEACGFFKPRFGPTLSAGCGNGKEQPRIVVELATPISLTPDWHLASKARLVRVEPASTKQRDHCDVSFLNKDVTPQVVDAARSALRDQLPGIDARISKVDLTEHVTEWWGLLSRPIKLADAVWLVIGPERLRLGHVTGHQKILVVPVSLDARPRIVVGPAEPAIPPMVLPALARDTAAAEGYRIVMDGIIDYGTASRELTSAFAAKSITESGHTITLRSVRVMPQPKGKLGLTVTFTGDARGTLLLVGSPLIDHVHDLIVVPDLDFDLQSSDKLLKTYTWLKAGSVRKQLRERARIPTAPALEKGRGLLLQGLNRKLGDAVTLTGTVDSVGVRSLFVTRDGLVVRAEAAGRAGMAVKQR